MDAAVELTWMYLQRVLRSHSTASFDNAVRGPAGDGVQFNINQSGASSMRRLSVAVLANGTTIRCALRLDPAHA